MKNGLVKCALCILLLAVAPLPSFADDDLGVTMRMVTDDESLTESVVREIELREPVGLKSSGEPSREAREAREVQNGAREFGQSMAERAREMRQSRDVGNDPEGPEIPEMPPIPERPQVPEQGRR